MIRYGDSVLVTSANSFYRGCTGEAIERYKDANDNWNIKVKCVSDDMRTHFMFSVFEHDLKTVSTENRKFLYHPDDPIDECETRYFLVQDPVTLLVDSRPDPIDAPSVKGGDFAGYGENNANYLNGDTNYMKNNPNSLSDFGLSDFSIKKAIEPLNRKDIEDFALMAVKHNIAPILTCKVDAFYKTFTDFNNSLAAAIEWDKVFKDGEFRVMTACGTVIVKRNPEDVVLNPT